MGQIRELASSPVSHCDSLLGYQGPPERAGPVCLSVSVSLSVSLSLSLPLVSKGVERFLVLSTELSGTPWIPALRCTIHNEPNGPGTLGAADSLLLKSQPRSRRPDPRPA